MLCWCFQALCMLSSALPSASPMSFHQRCICDSYRLHRLIWMTSAHTMIRKSTANCTRTVTTSSCASTTTESKNAGGATRPLRHWAPQHLNLSSRTANSTSTVASKDRNVYWWPNAIFSTLRLSVYTTSSPLLCHVRHRGQSAPSTERRRCQTFEYFGNISVKDSSPFCFFTSIYFNPVLLSDVYWHSVCLCVIAAFWQWL